MIYVLLHKNVPVGVRVDIVAYFGERYPKTSISGQK